MAEDHLWQTIREEVATAATQEPVLASFFHAAILNHSSLDDAVSFLLAGKLDGPTVPAMLIREVIDNALAAEPAIGQQLRADINAYFDRDPACDQYCLPLLYFKGFHALQLHRVSHWLWCQGRKTLALFLQNQMSQIFGVDIHPGATVGEGIMIDHATGVVVGETAVIGNNVSMLHNVTLGGTGHAAGDRHPKVGDGVLISAGAKVLGNIRIGEGAKIGAGSVVLTDVPPHTTVVGVPAKVVGRPQGPAPALDMNQLIDEASNEL